jgi:hypothetical protein
VQTERQAHADEALRLLRLGTAAKAGVIASSKGRPSVMPAPRSMARREAGAEVDDKRQPGYEISFKSALLPGSSVVLHLGIGGRLLRHQRRWKLELIKECSFTGDVGGTLSADLGAVAAAATAAGLASASRTTRNSPQIGRS